MVNFTVRLGTLTEILEISHKVLDLFSVLELPDQNVQTKLNQTGTDVLLF